MTCEFCLPHVIVDHPEAAEIQANFEWAAGVASSGGVPSNSPLLGFAGSAVAGTYATDYIATEETLAGSAATWSDLTTVGPSVSIDIPQFSLVIFTATVKMWEPNSGASQVAFKLVHTGGGFGVDAGYPALDTVPPGSRSTATAEPTHPFHMSTNLAYNNDLVGTHTYRSAPYFFHAGTALTTGTFKLQYHTRWSTAHFKERRLSVLAVALS